MWTFSVQSDFFFLFLTNATPWDCCRCTQRPEALRCMTISAEHLTDVRPSSLFTSAVSLRPTVSHFCSHNTSRATPSSGTKHAPMKKVFVVQAAPFLFFFSSRFTTRAESFCPALVSALTLGPSCFPGKRADRISTLAALQDAKEVVKAFWKSSGSVPNALSVLDDISKKLRPQVGLKLNSQKPEVLTSRVALFMITYINTYLIQALYLQVARTHPCTHTLIRPS